MNEQEEKALFEEYLSLWPALLRRTISAEKALHMGALLDRVEAAGKDCSDRARAYVKSNLARTMFGDASREEIGAEIYAIHDRVWADLLDGKSNLLTALGESELLKELAIETGTYHLVSSLQDQNLKSSLNELLGKGAPS